MRKFAIRFWLLSGVIAFVHAANLPIAWGQVNASQSLSGKRSSSRSDSNQASLNQGLTETTAESSFAEIPASRLSATQDRSGSPAIQGRDNTERLQPPTRNSGTRNIQATRDPQELPSIQRPATTNTSFANPSVANSTGPIYQGDTAMNLPAQVKISVDFAGGTIGEYVDAVKKEADSLNLIVTESAKELKLPKIALKNVPVNIAVKCIEQCFDPNKTIVRVGGEVQGVQFIQAEIVSTNQVEVLNVRHLISDNKNEKEKENFLAAVETGLQMQSETTKNLKIKFHEETGLLFLSGDRSEISLVQRIVSELSPKYPRGMSGGMTGGMMGGSGFGMDMSGGMSAGGSMGRSRMSGGGGMPGGPGMLPAGGSGSMIPGGGGMTAPGRGGMSSGRGGAAAPGARRNTLPDAGGGGSAGGGEFYDGSSEGTFRSPRNLPKGNVPSRDVPSRDVPSRDVPSRDVPKRSKGSLGSGASSSSNFGSARFDDGISGKNVPLDDRETTAKFGKPGLSSPGRKSLPTDSSKADATYPGFPPSKKNKPVSGGGRSLVNPEATESGSSLKASSAKKDAKAAKKAAANFGVEGLIGN